MRRVQKLNDCAPWHFQMKDNLCEYDWTESKSTTMRIRSTSLDTACVDSIHGTQMLPEGINVLIHLDSLKETLLSRLVEDTKFEAITSGNTGLCGTSQNVDDVVKVVSTGSVDIDRLYDDDVLCWIKLCIMELGSEHILIIPGANVYGTYRWSDPFDCRKPTLHYTRMLSGSMCLKGFHNDIPGLLAVW